MKVWNIVNGTENALSASELIYRCAKFATRRYWALATIVSSVEQSLLYLVGNPEDLITVWQKLAKQFEKETWANKQTGPTAQTALLAIEGWWLCTEAH